MWLVDNKTIKYVSPAVETITGYKPQEFIEDAVIFPIKDNYGAIINYAKIARDVTAIKKTEEALR